MKMKHLSDFHIAHRVMYDYILKKYDDKNYDQLVILRDEVKELILPWRTNFNFEISRSYDKIVCIVCIVLYVLLQL